MEALELRARSFREAREARQAARLLLLKDIHLRKVPTESIFLGSSERRSDRPIVKRVKSKQIKSARKVDLAATYERLSRPKSFVKPSDSIRTEVKFEEAAKLRRSLSTVHFKKLGENATERCFERTLSTGNLKNDYELPVASEKKKSVTFFSPVSPIGKNRTPSLRPNAPEPSELRRRLNDWLQKRGKSLGTFHHLKCFGLKDRDRRHLSTGTVDASDEDENKENEEVVGDDSFDEEECKRALISDVLCDLNRLILEEYSWRQCAEWLRAVVREHGESVKDIPAYWECRAALEEKRGDFVRTVDCYNNALQKGAQPKSVEESLDRLLDKFMKLNMDPATESADNKSLDAKNVFKSFLIKFAIRQAEERFDGSAVKKKYTATPVCRSSRIPNAVKSQPSSGRKHLVQLCDSLRNVRDDIRPTLVFVPNKALQFTD